MEYRVFQMGGIICLIAAGSCHWRGVFSKEKKELEGKKTLVSLLQKNGWEVKSWKELKELEEAGRQKLERIERWELEGK